VFVLALLFLVAWWLLRRSFHRAIHGGEPLKTQRAFWPVLMLTMGLGGWLVARVVAWAVAHAHPLVSLGIAIVVVVAIAKVGREIIHLARR